ncbi:MAG: hypothetical protein OEW52_07110 [Thermoleophilia bacterium]|nr:hypothetical protein [Thermoleophilia bacterium]MDH4341084.1 hypothetical protein [Thermoleophilia bacterium]MDH5280906.1 hypothetical protein [Thermoleophilia bacterium]
MKIEHEFWIERSTQAVWAIELHDDVVTGCYGPLLLDDVEDDLLEAFDYSPGGAAWIEMNRDRFGTLKLAVPDMPET